MGVTSGKSNFDRRGFTRLGVTVATK